MSLPLLDERVAIVDADRDAVWQAVRTCAGRLSDSPHAALGRLLGAEPVSGFRIADELEGESVTLEGRHHFASYRLILETYAHGGSSTELRVRSLADFRGASGQVYRALLMGTRGHVLAVRHLIRTVRRMAEAA